MTLSVVGVVGVLGVPFFWCACLGVLGLDAVKSKNLEITVRWVCNFWCVDLGVLAVSWVCLGCGAVKTTNPFNRL